MNQCLNHITAGHDYFFFFFHLFYYNFNCQRLNMLNLKYDMNWQDLKMVDLHCVNSD